MENISANLPDASRGEIFQILAETSTTRIERIVSFGQSTPEGEWYDQEQDEWVMLVSGEAELVFDGVPAPLRMRAGDYLLIPAHQRHRVSWTTGSGQTVWLAVHL